MPNSSHTVLHSYPTWLPQTQTWMYNQVVHLPGCWTPHVVCRDTANLHNFRVPNLNIYEESMAGRLERILPHQLTESLESRRLAGYPLRRAKDTAYRAYQRRVLQRTKAQIFHSHFGTVGWLDLRAIRRSPVEHVVTFYGLDVNLVCQQDPRWLSRYAELFENTAAVFCEGPHMADRVVDLGCAPEKVHVQHLGVDVDKIRFEPRHKRPDEPLRVLIAASFREKKGIPYALAALGQIRHEVPLQVSVIGDASGDVRSQREKKEILNTVEKYSLQDEVEFLGYVSHAQLMKEAYSHHIFLSPSVEARSGDTEGGAPVTILEMMATGMPVLSTTHCDIPELIKNGETGLLVEERDIGGLVHQLRWLAAHADRWAKMGRSAREHVEQEFDVRRQGERQAALYSQLLS